MVCVYTCIRLQAWGREAAPDRCGTEKTNCVYEMKRNVLSQHCYVSMDQPGVQSAMYAPTTTSPLWCDSTRVQDIAHLFEIGFLPPSCVWNVMAQGDDDSIVSRLVCVCPLPTMMCDGALRMCHLNLLCYVRMYVHGSMCVCAYVRMCIHVCDTRSDGPMCLCMYVNEVVQCLVLSNVWLSQIGWPFCNERGSIFCLDLAINDDVDVNAWKIKHLRVHSTWSCGSP